MTEDKYNLREKSDTELHAWVLEHKVGTEEHHAGVEESMRRVAILEQAMEREEAPAMKREFIAVNIAIVSIIVMIAAIVYYYQ